MIEICCCWFFFCLTKFIQIIWYLEEKRRFFFLVPKCAVIWVDDRLSSLIAANDITKRSATWSCKNQTSFTLRIKQIIECHRLVSHGIKYSNKNRRNIARLMPFQVCNSNDIQRIFMANYYFVSQAIINSRVVCRTPSIPFDQMTSRRNTENRFN